MKILQILPELNGGGVERGTLDIAQALVKAGHESHVASQGGILAHRLIRNGSHHHTFPLKSKNPFKVGINSHRLTQLIANQDIQLIHARSRAPAWSAFMAARRAKIPFVTTFHGTYNRQNLFKHQYNKIMVKGDRVIAISAFIKTHLMEHYKVPEEKIHVIPRGIDLDQFSPQAVKADWLQELSLRLRLPDDRPIIMLPARLTRWKGHLFLLDALAILAEKLRTQRPNQPMPFLCLLLGDDQVAPSFVAQITKKITQLNLNGLVQFAGHSQDVPTALMLTDVVVSASLEPEAFGRTTAEAQAMGRPVIAPAHGGALEQVISGKTGWLYPPNDAPALADCLIEALSLNQAKRAELAASARKHVENHFSLTQMTNKTLALYETLHQLK